MFRTKRKMMPLLLAGMLLPTLLGSSLIPPEEISDDTAHYRTTVVELGDIVTESTCPGNVYFPAIHDVYFEGAPSRYVKQLVLTGKELQPGDGIFDVLPQVDEIHISELELQKEELATRYQDAEVLRVKEREKLQREYNSAAGVGDVYTAGILEVSLQEHDLNAEKAKYDYERQLQAIDEEITELREQLEKTTVSTPFGGKMVWIQTYNEGTIIHEGEKLLTVTDLEKPYIRTTKPIPAGTPVKVKLKYRNIEVETEGVCVVNCLFAGGTEGAIIEADLSMAKEYVEDLTLLDSPMVGIGVTYNEIELKNVLKVSEDALIKEGNFYYAEILDDENVIHKRPVKVLILKGGVAAVLSGLSEGDKVILQ